MLPIAWSAEFPNDNPLLHEGAVWICTTVRGAPRAILRARASVPPESATTEPEPEPVHVAAELETEPLHVLAEPEGEPEPVHAVAEPEPVQVSAEPEPELEPVQVGAEAEPIHTVVESEIVARPEPDPFSELVRAIADVLLEAGATRAAALVPSLLERPELGMEATGSASVEQLVTRGFLEQGPNGIVPSAGFATTTAAWRRVLRGELADLTDCGNATLDQWASEIVVALVGAPASRSDDFRRQLRRRGVAAFGMLEKAA